MSKPIPAGLAGSGPAAPPFPDDPLFCRAVTT